MSRNGSIWPQVQSIAPGYVKRSSNACTRLTTPPLPTPLRPPSRTMNISCCRHREAESASPFTLPFPFPLPRRVSRESPTKAPTWLSGGGGVDVSGKGDVDVIEGATGDMGENGTASFDPFFFFHHAFIDCVFGSGNRSTTRPLA